MSARAVRLAALLAALLAAPAARPGLLEFSADEVAAIARHGPWPPPLARDASNLVSGSREAAGFGEKLFADARLSADGATSCATCHVPALQWTDRRTTARAHAQAPRNTPSVLNARFNRWFGWAGAADSLWLSSIRPLTDAREMGGAERHVVALVRSQADLARGYAGAFGRPPPGDDDELLADVGKALAAFQETLVTGPSAFDRFRDALARGDRGAAARYPVAAQRGLRLFVGRAQCNLCHFGPAFTNGEFDKVGIPVRDAAGAFDWGRYDGVKALRASRFNRLSRHSDDKSVAGAVSTRHAALNAGAYGAFKVPGLRNVALTAPYMHNGSLATLHDVVRHYSEINAEKLHIAASHPHPEPGEPLPPRPAESPLRTLALAEAEIDDLVAFLRSLTERNAQAP